MSEYEHMVKEFMPALRAKSAKLMDNRGLSQKEIAHALNMTQAAISKYLSGKYSHEVKIVEKTLDSHEVGGFVERLGEHDAYGAQRHVCRMCARNLSFRCRLMIK
jgi:predicted transcriptional regulator